MTIPLLLIFLVLLLLRKDLIFFNLRSLSGLQVILGSSLLLKFILVEDALREMMGPLAIRFRGEQCWIYVFALSIISLRFIRLCDATACGKIFIRVVWSQPILFFPKNFLLFARHCLLFSVNQMRSIGIISSPKLLSLFLSFSLATINLWLDSPEISNNRMLRLRCALYGRLRISGRILTQIITCSSSGSSFQNRLVVVLPGVLNRVEWTMVVWFKAGFVWLSICRVFRCVIALLPIAEFLEESRDVYLCISWDLKVLLSSLLRLEQRRLWRGVTLKSYLVHMVIWRRLSQLSLFCKLSVKLNMRWG